MIIIIISQINAGLLNIYLLYVYNYKYIICIIILYIQYILYFTGYVVIIQYITVSNAHKHYIYLMKYTGKNCQIKKKLSK